MNPFLFKQITSPNIYVRKESIKLIKQIAELQSKSVYQLVLPFSEILKCALQLCLCLVNFNLHQLS